MSYSESIIQTASRVAPILSRGSARLRWPVLVLCLLTLALLTGCQETDPIPRVSAGNIDLTDWDFAGQGVVALEGEWEICWNTFVPPEDGDCPGEGWKRIPVPRLWSDSGVSSPIGGKGIASYRMRLELPSGADAYTLRAGSPMTSYELFINGDFVGGSGSVGGTPEETSAKLANRNYVLPRDATQIDLLVHVANFEFRGGGLRRTWYVGPTDLVVERNARELLLYAAFAAAAAVVGLLFLAQFAFRLDEKARGWLGLFSLLVAVRMIPGTSSDVYQLVLGWVAFGPLIRLEYMNTALLIVSALGYLRARVPGIMPPRTTRLLFLIALALVPIHLFAPLSPTFLAMCIFSIGVIHDIIRTETGLGASIELFPYFVIAWLTLESRALLQAYARVYSRVEALSADLQEANFELQETEEAIVRFVPFDFMRSLGKETIRDVRSGDQARVEQMSVLHCELQVLAAGATANDPAREFARRARFVARFERCAIQRGGFLGGVQGAGLQAFFPNAAEDAVEAALAILDETDAAGGLASSGTSEAEDPIEVSIGIDTGPVVLGVLGSAEQLLRSVVGEPVERASRLAAAAAKRSGKLLVSAATRERLKDEGELRVRGTAPVKDGEGGMSIDAFEILRN